MNQKCFVFMGCFIMVALVAVLARADETFFIDCEDAFQRPMFHDFAMYIEQNDDVPRPDKCFRLNDHEFLATVTGTGRVRQGLYFFDAKKKTFEPVRWQLHG